MQCRNCIEYYEDGIAKQDPCATKCVYQHLAKQHAGSFYYVVSPVPRLSWSFLKRWRRRKDLRSLHADRAVSLLTFVQSYSGGYTLVRRHKQGRWWWSPDFVSDCASLFHKCSCSLIGREGKVCVFVLLSAIRALEQCACVRLFSPSISAAQK